jgi:IS5 family transposase
VRAIGAKLKLRSAAGRDEAQAIVLRLTGELAGLAQRSGRDACVILDNARRALQKVTGGRRDGYAAPSTSSTSPSSEAGASSLRPGAVSLVTSPTRPFGWSACTTATLARSRRVTDRPVGFGYKAQVVDNEDGIVLDYTPEEGNPADAAQLAPAIARITQRVGEVPAAVTADRGYGEASVENDLRAIGVKTVAIPRKGQPGPGRRATEHTRGFRELITWRTGCEGRISHLKHRYGWARTGAAGLDRATD